MSIHLLADQGDKSGVAQCIAARVDVNEADTTGQKPLHYAAAKGFGEVVALLLQNEADPNSKSDRGTTPLHEAAKAGKLETVALLLENKADPSSTDNDQKTPLHYAIASGNTKVVSRLLEHGADINIAAKDGTTPLHIAATKGSLPLMRLLIEKGARIDARDGRGNTALASIPLAERALLEVPAPPHKLAADIKLMLTQANGKPSAYKNYDDEGNDNLFSDVTFTVDGGHQIHAHRNIVSLRCPRLGKLFKHSQQDKVDIRDISHTTFQALLEWLYSDDVANLRSSDPDVHALIYLLIAADRFALKDLKAQCEAVAMRNISTANVAAIWSDLRKCASVSPDLYAYTAHLIARNWNVLASSKMASDMTAADVVELCNLLTIGEIKEEIPEPVAKPQHRISSPKRRPTPHAHTQPEAPVRTQPDRAAHRHAPPAQAAPPPPEPAQADLPPDFSLLNIGNNTYLADPLCKMEGKNARSAKLIHGSLIKHKLSWPFMEPVDPVKLGIPNYRDIIKEPMDLGTIKTNLDRDAYATVNQYARDVRLVFVNALTFNRPGFEIYKMSETLLKTFNDKFIKTNWEISSSNGDSYPEAHSPTGSTSASQPPSAQTKSKRKSGTFPTPSAPPQTTAHSRASNGHHSSSPSPSPPPSPPPVKERTQHQLPPKEKAPAPPPPPPEEEMSYEDKKELGNKMHRLEPHQLSHVIAILGAKSQSDDDIEIDLDDVPVDKLRILDKYVNECLFPNKQKRRHKGEDEEDVVIDDQEPETGNWEPGRKGQDHKHKKKKYGRDDDD